MYYVEINIFCNSDSDSATSINYWTHITGLEDQFTMYFGILSKSVSFGKRHISAFSIRRILF